MRYPVLIEKSEDGYIATISHPNGRFQGACEAASRSAVKAEAEKLLVAIIISALKNGDEIPAPQSCYAGNAYVTLPLQKAVKAIGIRQEAAFA